MSSATNNEDQQVKDVVCGMIKPISQMKAKAVYKGDTYYFCSDQDKEIFEANPEHWIPKEVKRGGALMSDCCSDHNKEDKKEEKDVKVEKMPKSLIGKYLYKLGKEETEKGKHKKDDCC